MTPGVDDTRSTRGLLAAVLALALAACGPMTDEALLAAWPALPVAERTGAARAILTRGLLDGATEAEVVAALGRPGRGDRRALDDGAVELVYTVGYRARIGGSFSHGLLRDVLRLELVDGVVVRGEFAER